MSPTPQPPRPRVEPRPRRAGAVVLALVFAALAWVHIRALWFVCDDAFISFRYAANWAHGHGLVYNPGERVEGYSNFAWTVLAGVFMRLGWAPDSAMPIVSCTCALITLAIVMAWAWRRGFDLWLAGALTAANAALAAWATGGLETALFTTLVTGGAFALSIALEPRTHAGRALPASALLLGLAALTRPDGALVLACAGACVWVGIARGAVSRRLALAWLGVAAVVVVPHLLWRHAYYGRWVPNTFGVKAPGAGLAAQGAAYLWRAAAENGLLFLLIPVVAVVVSWVVRRRGAPAGDAWIVGALGLPYLGYVIGTGGDFMPLGRFVAPVLPLAVIGALLAIQSLLARATSAGATWALQMATFAWLALYAAAELHATGRHQRIWAEHEIGSVGFTREDTANWRRVGALLRRSTEPSDTLATTAAGIIPYITGLYTIDLLGLAAPDLSHYRHRATARPGHALLLDERWIVAARPQLLLGHPLVLDSTHHLGLSLDLDPAERDRVLADYRILGFGLLGSPPRYFACALRKDVAERVVAASREAATR